MHLETADFMMIANRVANESVVPVLADEIANDTMIGVETCIFFDRFAQRPGSSRCIVLQYVEKRCISTGTPQS